MSRRTLLIPINAPRAFLTALVPPTGTPSVTFHILTEIGDVIDAETGDQTRTE